MNCDGFTLLQNLACRHGLGKTMCRACETSFACFVWCWQLAHLETYWCHPEMPVSASISLCWNSFM